MDKDFLDPMIKIGIYDRYLSTMGGGERYSCKMAEILSKQKYYSVDLLTDIHCDKEKISERLNLDLGEVGLKVFGYISDEYAKSITSAYDIFINATYLSPLKGHSKKNIYLCYFPTPFDVDFKLVHRLLLVFFRLPAKWLYSLSERIISRLKTIEVKQGLYDIKRFMLKRGSWSNGDVRISLKGLSSLFTLGLKNPEVAASPVEMDVDLRAVDVATNRQVYSKVLKITRGTKQTVSLDLEKGREYELSITSDTFYPEGEEGKDADTRKLGVALYDESGIGAFRKMLLKCIGFVPLFLVAYPRDLSFLKSYEYIIAISEYSKYWIKKLWSRESLLLFPPVDIENFSPAKKEKIILSVGRFFPEHHNKKQLELARAFIELKDSHPEKMEGYELYLVGGLSDRQSHVDYVKSIKDTIKGYPVKVLTNASWEELGDIFSRAEIFWHASGMGEEEDKHPERFEHFGITTVEAMAAGCIPIVIDKGGQKEIIEHGIDGFLFKDLKELEKHTLDVISGRADAEKIRENAIKGCRRFSNDEFAKMLLKIIDKAAGDVR